MTYANHPTGAASHKALLEGAVLCIRAGDPMVKFCERMVSKLKAKGFPDNHPYIQVYREQIEIEKQKATNEVR